MDVIFVKGAHDRKTLTVIYEMADGTLFLRSGGKISWRFNNPGNVRPNESKSPEYTQPLRIGIGNTKSGEFSIFGCYEHGWAAKKKLLKSPLYRDKTIDQMMPIYAPKKDNNDPEAYARYVLKKTGVSPNLTLGEMDDATLNNVMEAMKTKEGYYADKETQKERWVYVTNITVSDGARPIAEQLLKVKIGSTTYEWKTDNLGKLKTIAHLKLGEKLEIYYENDHREDVKIYSSVMEEETKNIILTKEYSQYTASTASHEKIVEPPKVAVEENSSTAKGEEKTKPEQNKVVANRTPINYIVQPGDTLGKLAKLYQVDIMVLAKENGIKDANKIYPGKKLVIYGKSNDENSSEQQVNAQNNDGGKTEEYTVKHGDTLNKIANEHGTSINRIADDNKITHINTIFPGQKLIIKGSKRPEEKAKKTQGEKTESAAVQKNVPNNTQKEITETRSKEGTGAPLALLPHDQKIAPWMAIAVEEAERWGWGKTKESTITKSINYHAEVSERFKKSLPNLIGKENAWCASFVNYCLKYAGYEHSNSAGSQSFAQNKNFVKIPKAIYGAIAVYRNSGHVALVYCKTQNGDIAVLGGNQSDAINLNSHNNYASHRKWVGFYVPIAYYEYAIQVCEKGDDLEVIGYKTVLELNNTLSNQQKNSTSNKTT